jgi:hypothetical protein
MLDKPFDCNVVCDTKNSPCNIPGIKIIIIKVIAYTKDQGS